MDKSHDIVADIKAIAVEIGETPTLVEYIKHGQFSERQINKAFGRWSVAIQAAGLAPKKRGKKNLIEKKVENFDFNNTIIKERYESEILPYFSKYARAPSGSFRVLVASDLHSVYLDPFCNHVLQDVNKRVKPEVIQLNGDIYDFPLISRFDQDPTRLVNMQKEIDYVENYVFTPLRKNNPDAEIWLLIGASK